MEKFKLPGFVPLLSTHTHITFRIGTQANKITQQALNLAKISKSLPAKKMVNREFFNAV